MSDDFNFYYLIAAPGLEGYAGVIDELWTKGLFEALDVKLHCEAPEIKAFLLERFGWSVGQPAPPLKELIVALARKFPPPYPHAAILDHRVDPRKLLGGESQSIFDRDALDREENYIKISMTLESPGGPQFPNDEYLDCIENQYKPMLLDLVGHEDFFPDDFETTINLCQGQPDIIRKEDRTLEVVLPCRDVTGSVRLLAIALRHRFCYDLGQIGGPDVHAWFLNLGVSPCLHLFCIAFGSALGVNPSLKLSLVPRPSSVDM